MGSHFVALIDACVLYQAPVRDLIIQLARAELFRGRWTIEIQKEWIENLLKNRPDLNRTRLERTCQLMNETVLDCLVEDYKDLIPETTLPDKKDSHVLAAAIKSQAQVIVTCNLKDFPQTTLDKYSIEAQHPDTFCRYQMDLNLPKFLSCVKSVRMRLKNPPRTPKEYLFALYPHLPQTINLLKPYVELI